MKIYDCQFTPPYTEFQICIEKQEQKNQKHSGLPDYFTEAAMLPEMQRSFPFFPFGILCKQYLELLYRIFTIFSLFSLSFDQFCLHPWRSAAMKQCNVLM